MDRYKRKRRFVPTVTEQLAILRNELEPKLTLKKAAEFFKLKDEDTISNWENGWSKPPERRHRKRFIGYLLYRLGLINQHDRFIPIWKDIMEGQWEWKPLSGQELKKYFPGIYVANKEDQLQISELEYIDWGRNHFKNLDTWGITTPPDVEPIIEAPFKKMFIPLELTEGQRHSSNIPPEGLGLAREFELSDPDWYKEKREFREKRKSENQEDYIPGNEEEGNQSLTIADILDFRRFVVLGNVGTGKSTLLRSIANSIFWNDRTDVGKKVRGRIPIYIEIVDYAKELKTQPSLRLITFGASLETEFSDGQRDKAMLIGLKTVPLHQNIE